MKKILIIGFVIGLLILTACNKQTETKEEDCTTRGMQYNNMGIPMTTIFINGTCVYNWSAIMTPNVCGDRKEILCGELNVTGDLKSIRECKEDLMCVITPKQWGNETTY